MVTSKVIVTVPPGGRVPRLRLTCAYAGALPMSSTVKIWRRFLIFDFCFLIGEEPLTPILSTSGICFMKNLSMGSSGDAGHRWHAGNAGDIKRIAIAQGDRRV